MNALRDLNKSIGAMPEASPFASLGLACRALALRKSLHGDDASAWLDQNHAPPAAHRMFAAATKGAVGTADIDLGVGGGGAVSTWAAALAPRSAFMRGWSDNAFVKAPLNSLAAICTTPAIGHAVGEGRAVPLSPFGLQSVQLTPVRVEAVVVLSKEQLTDVSSEGQSTVNKSLADAIAKAVDEAFFGLVASTDTPSIPATSNVFADLRAAALAVANEGGKIYFVTTPAVAAQLATLSAGGLQVFPAVGLASGELLGRPLLTSAGCPVGSIFALNTAAIAAGAEPVRPDSSQHASLEMRDDPISSSGTPTGTSLVSLWQTNSVALGVRTTIGAVPLRDDAVVEITGANYGA